MAVFTKMYIIIYALIIKKSDEILQIRAFNDIVFRSIIILNQVLLYFLVSSYSDYPINMSIT